MAADNAARVLDAATAFNAAQYTYAAGTNADKYKVAPYPAGYFSTGTIAMQAIIMENRIELAEEGQRFFDLQRWQLYGNPIFPTPGSNFMTTTLNTYAQIENQWHPAQYPSGLTFTTGKCEYYPIPLQQIQGGKRDRHDQPQTDPWVSVSLELNII